MRHTVGVSPTESVPWAGVFGGGGLFGIGYALGIIDGLRDRGIDLSRSPMLGTSAGSWAAAATALGITFDELVELPVPKFPDPRSEALATVARAAFGERRSPLVRAVVTALPRMRRTVLSGSEVPLAQLVAASSAVPGLLAPQRIEGRWYLDGGLRSGVSVDLADRAESLLVIAPLAGAMFGPFGRYVEGRTDAETAAWSAAHGGRILEFSPTRTTSHIATRPQHLFDRQRAVEAYHHGRFESSEAVIA